MKFNDNRLIVDGSSILWYGLKAGVDEEHGQTVVVDGKERKINGWLHGYEHVINSLVAAWTGTGIQPKDTIFVHESGNSKGYRRQFYEDYKGSDSRCEEEYEQFNTLKEKIIDVVRSLGGQAVTRPHMEGDDTIAYLVSSLPGRRVIMSQDRDLSFLLTIDGVQMWRSAQFVKENEYGPFSFKLLPVYKALVGDPSDKIPGAKGFGPKSWLDMLSMFGEEGLMEVERMIVEDRLHELEGNISDLKVIGKIVEQKELVKASYLCGLLYPDKVVGKVIGLDWLPGYVKQKEYFAHDDRLAPYAGTQRIVHANNKVEMLAAFRRAVKSSDSVALDIETSTPEESDEWLQQVKGRSAKDDNDLGVDVIGSELNGMSITFGRNHQHTIYMTCGHAHEDRYPNMAPEDILEFVEAIPEDIPVYIHNVMFEQPVLFNTWKHIPRWRNKPFWYGFVPNAVDTMFMAMYVNENVPKGLKSLTKRYFDYDQVTYAEVTQGRKMNQLTPSETLAYGADDTIMTAGLAGFFRIIMHLEKTWDAFEQVEILPPYLASSAFVKGMRFSLQAMRKAEDEDTEKFNEAERVLHQYLADKGWDGTIAPQFESADLAVPAKIKEIVGILSGVEMKCQFRIPEKLYIFVENMGDENPGYDFAMLAGLMREGQIDRINEMIAKGWDHTPRIDLESSSQMQRLLYNVMNVEPRLLNPLTDKQRTDNTPEGKALREAVYQFNKIYRGSKTTKPLTPEQMELVKTRASGDKFAVEFALAFDAVANPEIRPILKAIQTLSQVSTRRKLYYNKLPSLVHWKTGRIHPSLNQSATVTGRHSSSAPNVQQLGKRGEGVKVRGVIIPHKPNAWIVANDFNGQELRLGADLSRDPAMLACYIGDNLRDIHSIMASHPNMLRRWGDELDTLADKYGFDLSNADGDMYYEFFRAVYDSGDEDDAKLADDLRKLAKNVVFGTQYDAMAPTLAKSMTVTVDEAQTMLEAKQAMFPVYDEWKEKVVQELRDQGYLTTYLGRRRHLAEAMASQDKWVVSRAERQGPNFMIQGGGAEQTKLVMAEIWRRGIFERYDAEFIAPIHDEVVYSVSDEDKFACMKEVHECMTRKYLPLVPTLSSISIGKNFAQQYEVGTTFDEALIQSKCDRALAAA